MEQVCIDLSIQLIFSTVGMPRGRGRIERFFLTVNQLLLHRLPGYAPEGKPVTPAKLTLSDFDPLFREFLLGEYHLRRQQDMSTTPQVRWEADSFLPRLPESLEELDLLLLTVAKTRRVRRDGIYFQCLRYMDPTLADYVGEDVVIRYDPRDMAEIRVFYANTFLCRAVCQELAGQTVSLKEIQHARNRRRQELRKAIKDRSELVQLYLKVHQSEPEPVPSLAQKTDEAKSPHSGDSHRLKLYENE